MKVKFGSRDNTEWAGGPDAAWDVEEMSWRAKGGPDVAWIQAPACVASLDKWIDLLRRPVEVYDSSGRAAWWGYVATVEVWRGGCMLSYSLEHLVNKVWCRFTDQWGKDQKTSAADSSLVHLYGVKETFFDMGLGDWTKAAALAGGVLQRQNNTRGPWKAEGGRGQASPVRVGLRGWWQSLSWKVYSDEGQGNVHSPVEWIKNTETSIGGTARQKGARSMTEWDTDYPAWTPFEVEFMARGSGTNTDQLRVSIQALVGGVPSGIMLDYVDVTVATAALISTYRVNFSRTAQILRNSYNIIVFSRTGAISDTNYYLLGLCAPVVGMPSVDTENRLVYWTGTVWTVASPVVGVMLKVNGFADTGDLAGYCAAVNEGGQFLRAQQVESKSGIFTGALTERIYDYQRQAEELLDMGSVDGRRMLAEVGVDRTTRIYKALASTELDLLMDGQGRMVDTGGRALGPADRIAGRWVKLAAWTDAPAMFAEVVQYAGKSGALTIAGG